MTKRKSHAKKPAAGQPETVVDTQSAGGVEPEAPALVEADGAGPDTGAEDQGGAIGTVVAADEAAFDAGIPYAPGEGQGAAFASGLETDVAGNDGRDDQHGDGGVPDAAGGPADAGDGSGLGAELDGDGGRDPAPGDGAADAGALGPGGRDAVHDDGAADGQDAGGEGAAGSLSAEGGAADQLDPDGNPAGDDAPADASYFRAADHHAENVEVARGVASMVLDQVLRIMGNGQYPAWQMHEAYGEVQGLTPEECTVGAKLLREIGGQRATCAVVETQLKITGCRPRALLMPEQLALEAFLSAVTLLDMAAGDLEAAIAKATEEAAREPPKPIPLDETTLETVDDTDATW